ncbi:MAG: Single-stranded-DNA-specific exonuclease RecJ [Cytophagales bacterium]|jgi:single-stranded-DNA-specific exonuclease|nr:single-stranded-DNA-specific exonuclease RecJ [Bacteroidota bacterium]MBS1979987.1 single-stranded-DNA-specific exonuclease RecJ [Bacteroidota bacterium]WHZ07266.1 MAG: Single-stranded-DNA-specific exonuclease RecJ [Cytophagales bacterium]
MIKRWTHRPVSSSNEISELGKKLNTGPHLTALLWQRGLRDFDSVKKFFRPSLDHLHDPFLMKDMEQAVLRLKKAIDGQEKILIYGDYDVDGTTAVSMVYSYLKEFYSHCDFYIPDRYTEGYGVSEASITWAEENGFSLIVALDLGIKASDMVTMAAHKGIDFIICDHHLPGGHIPNAVAVLDPKRDDCTYPFKELSGCGLGFKLLQAYAKKYKNEDEVYKYLDLVAVSIASDIVPLNDENRVLTYFGLQKLNQDPCPGLKALKEIAAIKNDLDVSGIVFTLGPRINAAGRVAHAKAAVELLISTTEKEANALAEKVNLKNDLRREFDLSITEEAIAMIEGDEKLRAAKSTVLFKNTWNKGVIGIVAARCVEKFYRPTVILTESNDKVTGSARSVKDFDLYQALENCSELLEKYGGHKYAAGLTLDRNNVPAFQKKFEEVVSSSITEEMQTPLIEIDLTISLDAITPKFISILKQMAPFGPENQRPLFEARNLHIVNSLSSFKEKHIKFLVGQQENNSIFNVVGFDLAHYYKQLANGGQFRMAFSIEENSFNGTTSIQLRAKDIKFD